MTRNHVRSLVAATGALALGACAGDFPQSALHPASDFAGWLDGLFRSIFWWAVLVFVVVQAAFFYALVRFRARPSEPVVPDPDPGDDRAPEQGEGERPKPVHGHTLLEIGWTLAPALILVAIAIPTIRTIFVVDSPPPDRDLVVEVIARQWWWEFRYPELGVVTANEAHIPVGRRTEFRLRTADVIHSFWVPRLGGKRDMSPGRETGIWFTPDSAGVYMGQCAEFCGLAHALMGFRVVAEEPEAFEAWAERQRQPAAEPEEGLAAEGRELFASSVCIACHTVRGTPAAGVVGPDLTHMGSRRTIAAGVLPNTPENMARWLRDPQGVKPGNLMLIPELDEETIARLVAYMESLR